MRRLTGARRALPVLPFLLVLAVVVWVVRTPSAPPGAAHRSPARVETYAVDPMGTLSPEPSAAAARVWRLVSGIAATEIRFGQVRTLRIIDDPQADTDAAVWGTGDPQAWGIEVNTAYLDDPDALAAVIVHEVAHLISLQDDQFVLGLSCEQVEIPEGCMAPGSVLADFHARFWAGYSGLVPESDDSGACDVPAGDAFQAAHPGDFVTAYAASCLEEDLAETFAHFVLSEQEDWPQESAVVRAKLEFMLARPGLAQRRLEMRAAISAG